MRERKFRARDKNHHFMNYQGMGASFNKNEALTSGDILNFFEDEDVMQYTGLKDKHGNDIYEGDILCMDYPAIKPLSQDTLDSMQGAIVHPALIDGREAYTETLEVERPYIYRMDFDTTEWYVGGNIYENPELLK